MTTEQQTTTAAPLYVGGQAIIEGVMMKVKDRVAYAVRLPSGRLRTFSELYGSVTTKSRIFKLPVLRGIVTLGELTYLGMKILMTSANYQLGTEEQISTREILISVLISFVFAIGLFVVVPYVVSAQVANTTDWAFHVVDGVIRLIIFLLYLTLIGLMPDVHKIFQYHGAEHKVVNTFESGLPLTVKNARKAPLEHIRCGTSLLFIVIALSIVLFTIVRSEFWYFNILFRIFLIPVIGGIAYEIVKLGARWSDRAAVRWILAPGLLIQSLTTREPTGKQLEVAIKALQTALADHATVHR